MDHSNTKETKSAHVKSAQSCVHHSPTVTFPLHRDRRGSENSTLLQTQEPSMRLSVMHSLWLLPLFALGCNCHKHGPSSSTTAARESEPRHQAANAASSAASAEAGFVPLFDGHSMNGWKIGKNADSWKVQNGELVVRGPGPAHLFYDGPVHNHDWKNFHLKLMVMTLPHANSGVYFHTKYQEEGWPSQGFEAQVNQTQSD